MERTIVFVKACKVIALSIAMLPIAGCAVGVGLIFAGLVRAEAVCPE